ncbi:unnamed protein product [Pylaiella littoralis]
MHFRRALCLCGNLPLPPATRSSTQQLQRNGTCTAVIVFVYKAGHTPSVSINSTGTSAVTSTGMEEVQRQVLVVVLLCLLEVRRRRRVQEDLENLLLLFDPRDVQDYLDGIPTPTRQPVHWRCRWWERRRRFLPSRRFKTLFRCERPTFRALVISLYGTTARRRPLSGHGPYFHPCERVAMALYRLGHGAGVRATAILFDMSEGWVTKHTMSVVKLVLKKIGHVLQWPTVEEQKDIARAFKQRTGFEGACGAMDGSHIPVPGMESKYQSQYYNYKQFFSVVLLAVVDDRGLFRWICAGAPGSCGDSGIFKWSHFYKQIVDDQKLPEGDRTVIGPSMVILGDSAFQNCEWLLTPIDNPTNREQRFFNHNHSSSRFVVEHGFGRFKWKYQCCRHRMYYKLSEVPDVVEACVLLYNFILLEEGVGRDEVFTDNAPTRLGRGTSVNSGGAAVETRRERAMKQVCEDRLLDTLGARGSMRDRRRTRLEKRRLDDQRKRRRVSGPDPSNSSNGGGMAGLL